MRRTTIVVPDDLAALLEIEQRRRNQSTSQIVREALTAYLTGESAKPKQLRFAALGRSGHKDTAAQAEEILAKEWTRDRDR